MTPRVFLLIACALLCTGLAACGGSGDDTSASAKPAGAQAKLDRTFSAAQTSIDRAHIDASVRLDPEGLLKLAGPLALKVTGPFAAPAGATPARFDLGFAATLGGKQFRGAAISTGARHFLKLDDRVYTLGVRRQASGTAAKAHPGLAVLGIDPLPWITGVKANGSEQVAGVRTDRLEGDVDAKRMLADIGALLDTGGAGDILSPQLLGQIGDAVRSAKVVVWTGADDSILRQLAVDLTFRFKDAQSPIVGLDGGRLRLKVRLDDVNGAPVDVATPSGARPLEEVTGAGGLGAVLAGLGAGITGGIGGGAIELAGCVTGAGESSIALLRCLAKLAA